MDLLTAKAQRTQNRNCVLCVLYAFAANVLAWGQSGTTPKAKPAEYPAHVEAGGLGIGAEYLVRGFSGGGQSFFTPEYLVVEIALFPPRGGSVKPVEYQFALRLNRKNKQTVYAESPGMVAASLKYPDWERRPQVELGGGIGNAGVILGRPRTVGRFPGDRREPTPPPGTPPTDLPPSRMKGF